MKTDYGADIRWSKSMLDDAQNVRQIKFEKGPDHGWQIRCAVEIDIMTGPEEEVEQLLAELNAAVTRATKRYGRLKAAQVLKQLKGARP